VVSPGLRIKSERWWISNNLS